MSNILHQLSQLDWMHNWSPAKGRSHERLKRNRRAAVRLSSCTTVRSLSDMKVKMRHKSIKTEKWESFSDVFVFVLRIPELPESFTSIRPVSVQLSTFDTVFSSYKIDYLSSFVISIPVSPYGVNKSLKLTDIFWKSETRQSVKKWPFLGLPCFRDLDRSVPLMTLWNGGLLSRGCDPSDPGAGWKPDRRPCFPRS